MHSSYFEENTTEGNLLRQYALITIMLLSLEFALSLQTLLMREKSRFYHACM